MSNLVKSNYIAYDEEMGARVIDSNKLMEEKIQQLAMGLASEDADELFESEFIEGLDSEQMEMLLADQEATGEEGSKVLHHQQPQQPQVDVAAIESDANAHAQEILQMAKDEARDIVNAAIADAEQMKQTAREEGYAEGFTKAKAENDEKFAKLETELEEQRRRLETDYDAKLTELEPLFIDTLTDIYEHIFHVQFAQSKEIILYLLQDAIRRIESNKDFIVRVSKADYEYVSERKKELMIKSMGNSNIEIIEDITLDAGHCMIETDGGIFDCSIDTQLSSLEKELKLLSYAKE